MMQAMETPSPPAPALNGDYGAFVYPPEHIHPDPIAQQLLQLPEHEHLLHGEAIVDWLLMRDNKTKGGRHVLGTVYLPRIQGELNACFQWLLECHFGRMPDFLIILDQTYWVESAPRLREILVYHELCHCIHKENKLGEPMFDENERPRWGLRGHDVEEFTSVVRRYGAYSADLEYFIQAAATHADTARLERRLTGRAGT